MFNNTIFVGNIGADPKLSKTTEKQADVLNFSIAVEQQKNEKPQWVGISYFGRDCISVGSQLMKGMTVQVTGKPEFLVFEDKVRINLTASKIEFVEIVKKVVDLCAKQTEEV